MQTCTICKHKQPESIDRAIIERASERTIAARFGISKTTYHRHKTHVRELARVDMAKRAETVWTCPVF
jgi:hypothetical protein